MAMTTWGGSGGRMARNASIPASGSAASTQGAAARTTARSGGDSPTRYLHPQPRVCVWGGEWVGGQGTKSSPFSPPAPGCYSPRPLLPPPPRSPTAPAPALCTHPT